MDEKRALVTMATGPYEQQWQRLCRSNWSQWAERNGYDLRIFNQPLDHSPRALKRAPAWQKLLVMASSELVDYHTCLWVDADVLIHPQAPDPYEQLDSELFAVTIETGSLFSTESAFIQNHTQRALAEVAAKQGLTWTGGYFESWGFDSLSRPLFNNGVVGFNPLRHRNLLLDLYQRWEDGGPGSLAEMLPFNLVVQTSSWQELDGRYNRLIFPYASAWNHEPARTCSELGLSVCITNSDQFLYELFQRSYFLHFAGMHNLMERLGPMLLNGSHPALPTAD